MRSLKIQSPSTTKNSKQSPSYRWFGDVLTVSCLQDGSDQGFNAINLAHDDLVTLVITGQV